MKNGAHRPARDAGICACQGLEFDMMHTAFFLMSGERQKSDWQAAFET
jgi:hypothetical protein